MKILLIEDDKDLAATIRDQLVRFYEVDVVHDGALGVSRGVNPRYDAIILDVILPKLGGVEACQAIRAEQVKTPILMLTARDSVEQKVLALDAGADDYLTKPFNIEELLARLRALMRRPQTNSIHNPLSIGPIMINLTEHSVVRSGETIELRRKEFSLLEYLARHAGQVVTRQMIFDHVWDTDSDALSNTVDVHINYLRKKIDEPFDSKLIKTVPGLGYKLEV